MGTLFLCGAGNSEGVRLAMQCAESHGLGNCRSGCAAEDYPLRPLNTYGASKVVAEGLVDAAAEQGVRTAIARLTNVYGSRFEHPTRVVSAVCHAARNSRPITLFGPQREFDFVHIRDAVQGLRRMIEVLDRGESVPTLNLASGRGVTLAALARTATRRADSEVPVECRGRSHMRCRGGSGTRGSPTGCWDGARRFRSRWASLASSRPASLKPPRVARASRGRTDGRRSNSRSCRRRADRGRSRGESLRS